MSDKAYFLEHRNPSEEFVREKINIKKMNKKDLLNELFKKYELNPEDTFKHKHFHIITRSGIDKIQGLSKINITYELKHYSPEKNTCIIQAFGKKGTKEIQTFGEANPENNRNSYPVAIAEKRAMSRIVLKLCGFYELGIFGEDEAEDFKKSNN